MALPGGKIVFRRIGGKIVPLTEQGFYRSLNAESRDRLNTAAATVDEFRKSAQKAVGRQRKTLRWGVKGALAGAALGYIHGKRTATATKPGAPKIKAVFGAATGAYIGVRNAKRFPDKSEAPRVTTQVEWPYRQPFLDDTAQAVVRSLERFRRGPRKVKK